MELEVLNIKNPLQSSCYFLHRVKRFIHFIMFLLLLLFLSEVLSPKSWSFNASLQAWGYFNPGSQAALRRMLSDWARVQRSTVGRYEYHEDDVKKHQ